MQSPRIIAVAVVLALLAHSARADVVACAPQVPQGVVCLTGNVSDTSGGGPLEAGKVYHLSGFINVPVSEFLTIESGAILKFHPNALFEVRGGCSIGAATFMSLADDTAGGDTNGDGASVGAPGDWDGVVLYGGSGQVLTGTEILYAELGCQPLSDKVTLDGVTIRFCSGPALSLGNGKPTIKDCQLSDNDFAIRTASLRQLPFLTGNSASNNTQGDYVQVANGFVSSFEDFAIGPDNSLDGRPFVMCPTVFLEAGCKVELLPGTIFKFGVGAYSQGCPSDIGGITVHGTLITDSVVFTSLEDDTIGGDTAKDGQTFGTPGDWGVLDFRGNSDTSVLESTLVRFGGRFQTQGVPAINLTLADIELQDVDVVECLGDGLRLNNNSFPTVNGCSFSDNFGKAVSRVPLTAISLFTNNTAQNNALDALEHATGSGTALEPGHIIIEQANSLNGDGVFVIDNSVTLQNSGTMVLGGGVILKWKPGSQVLTLAGTLLTTGPVTMTSLRDDVSGGDTNKDGVNTQPEPGDWTGIVFQPGSDGSTLDRALIRYAGRAQSTTAAVTLSAASPLLSDTTIEHSESAALGLFFASFPNVTGCSFRDSDRAITGAPIRALQGFSNNSASGNANGDYIEVKNGDVSYGAGGLQPFCPFEIGPSMSLGGSGVFVLRDDIDVPAGFCLSMLPGTIIKWDGAYELDVDGFVEIGGFSGSVAFTSCNDDSVGGDTKNDGFTEGTPGDWRQISVAANGSTFENVLVRFAGSGNATAVALVGADTQLKSVDVLDCAGTALGIPGSTPLVDQCTFLRNIRAVDNASIRALPGFSNNSAEDNTLSDTVRVTDGVVTANVFVQASQAPDGRPFVLATDVNVLADQTLTLDGNVVFKFESVRRVNVQGTLTALAEAGATAIFTTLFDDIAGDTNKDDDATLPVPGSWRGLEFGSSSDASKLLGVRVRYAGASGSSILLSNADILLVDSLIEQSAGNALRLASSKPQVRRTSFVDGLGVPVDFASIRALPGFEDNTATGNVAGDFIRVNDASVSEDVDVAARNALNGNGVFVLDTSVTVNAGKTLSLRQGVILKFRNSNPSFTVNGALLVEGTGLEPVVLTSAFDDEFGGDTLKDGATTLPSPGDWGQLTLSNTGGPSTIEFLRVRYAGLSAQAVQLANPQAHVRGLHVEHSASDGIRASSLAGDAENWTSFQCAQDGIETTGGTFDLVHATVTQCGVGVRKGVGHIGALRNSISWGNIGGELVGFAPGDVFFSDVSPDFGGMDGNISADPLFVDAAAGHLSLGAGSPCVDAAELSFALPVREDGLSASRVLDDDLDGQLGADMGAFERSAYALTFGGAPRIGTEMTFTVHGAQPGVAVFYLGHLDGHSFQRPFGVTLYGPLGAGTVLGSAAIGQPLSVGMPPPDVSIGELFGVQALALPTGNPALARERGNLTNRYRGRLQP